MDLGKIIKKLEEVLEILKDENSVVTAPEARNKPSELDGKDVFEELKTLLNSEIWPQAAPDFLICEENEKDKIERADGIISYLGLELNEKNFLDFGCGEGHVVKHVAGLGAKKSIGYDIKTSENLTWNQEDGNFLLTTDFEKVKANAPYDYIVLYDVLDHSDDPVAILSSLRELMNDNSKVYVRCHPITSRHGTHQYRKLNKAFVQLVFTEDELKQIGLENDIKQKTYHPLSDNTKWFQKAKFKIVSHDVVKSPVEEFFKNTKIVASRITRPPYGKGFPDFQMQQVFNDYTLIKIN